MTSSSEQILLSPEEIRGALRAAVEAGDLAKAQVLCPQWLALELKDNIRRDNLAFDVSLLVARAICRRDTPMVVYLLEQSPYSVERFSSSAVSYPSPGVIQAFLDRGWDINHHDKKHGLALNTALRRRDIETVTWLLDHGADANAARNGYHPASCRIRSDHTMGNKPLDAAAYFCGTDVIDLLLRHGAQLERSNALHEAAGSKWDRDEGRIPIMRHLLDLGMKIDAISFDNDEVLRERFGAERTLGTPLHYAALGHPQRVRFLLEAGAHRESQATRGSGTPLDWARDGQSFGLEGPEVEEVFRILGS
ncbi:MAG: hypothetical protein M1817_001874 [Caeruleum heppii]|nr:MAG: hypothetical protein M1817_001874 [Caeruleum heppii]